MKVSSETSKALRTCASAIRLMTEPSSATLYVENSKSAVEELKAAMGAVQLEDGVDLLGIVPAATVASVLIGVADRVEEISEAVIELAHMAHFKAAVKPTVAPEKQPHLLHRGVVKPVVEGSVVIEVPAERAERCAETTGGNARAPSPDQDPPMKS